MCLSVSLCLSLFSCFLSLSKISKLKEKVLVLVTQQPNSP